MRFADKLNMLDGTLPKPRLVLMTKRDEAFEIRIGRPRAERGARLGKVKGAIGRAIKAKRSGGSSAPRSRLKAHFRKSGGKSKTARNPASRQVVVKARFVSHDRAGARGALKAHVAYLAREERGRPAPGAERAEELGRQVDYLARETGEGCDRYAFYDGAGDAVDARSLTRGWAEDERHFRLIVSPEDGNALGDLKPFVREVMGDLEQRLGTKLEWAAVDHWDTDNPHAHVLIRGRRADGEDLFIPKRVIAYEIRERAEMIATRILGPRPLLEQRQDLAREIATEGLTPLDREIRLQAPEGRIATQRVRRPDLLARLDQLQAWGLAARSADGVWTIHDGMEAGLQVIGAQVEARRMLAQADLLDPAFDILPASREAPTLGRLVHMGVADELSGRTLAIIEDGSGARRFAGFEREADLFAMIDAPEGAILEFAPREARVRPADEAVARVAHQTGGLYSEELHAQLEPRTDRALLTANTRRLEAMRRAGFVERRAAGLFEIANDHADRALAYEMKQVARAPLQPRVVSWLMLDEQEIALGPTHLDHVLAGKARRPEGAGAFAQDFEAALQRRRLLLIEEGIMGPQAQLLSRQALDRLARRELSHTVTRLSDELGMPVLIGAEGGAGGVYARRIDLGQGRVAVLVSERSAQLVPWRPAMERFAGREVEVLARGQELSFGLTRGVSLPPM